MNKYEIEIKSLLGSEENAKALIKKMEANDSALKKEKSHKQLNHYFIPTNQEENNLQELYSNTEHLIDDEAKAKFKNIINEAIKYSVRTRQADDKIILVVKASIDDTTSENGTARIEFEQAVENTTLEELDSLVLNSGFEYQAKWSRERTEYNYKGTNISIDKNAGYGYLAEFEKVINDETQADKVKGELRELMDDLEIEELPQDRLERMFIYYNENWPDYYGTEKIFNIE